jgi:hypothetical protein
MGMSLERKVMHDGEDLSRPRKWNRVRGDEQQIGVFTCQGNRKPEL